MIHTYFLATEAFVILGYLLGSALFPKRYPLLFYKFFGITVFCLLVWYQALFTGRGWTTLLPMALFITLGAIGIIAIVFRSRLRVPDKKELLVFLGIEILSYVIYLFFVYVRTFKTDILGTEKLMDVALINAIMKQNHIPIENPWLAGFYMNYYYFGHFVLAMFQYILQIPTAVGYNLAISLFGVWIAQAGYLVVKALRIKDLPAYLISLIMTFGGNLYLTVQSITHNSANQWFASATRVIPYTINEFPGYSVILGDLHGHYLSYPFFLVGIFLLLDIFFPEKEETAREDLLIPKSIFLGILLGHLYLTNSWDIFTLVALGGITVALISWYLKSRKQFTWVRLLDWYKKIVLFVGVPVVIFGLPQFLSSRSYYLPPVGGIGINTMFSNPWDMFLLFGQFLIIGLSGYGVLWFLYKKVGKQIYDKVLYSPEIALPLLLIIVGVVMIFAVEFVYAKDVFTTLNPPYARTNTVFKIYFHAWSLLSLGTISFFVSSFRNVYGRIKKSGVLFIFYGIFFGMVAIMLSYPFIGIDQYIAPSFKQIALNRITDPRWTNGYAYMNDSHGADYELVSYLLTKPSARLLEIVTYDSYSYYGRVSSYTGLSAVTGWPLHNVQWYNGYDGKGVLVDSGKLAPMKVADRVVDVDKMYTSTNADEVKSLLEKYQVTYAVFGEQEQLWAQEKQKKLNMQVYNSLCRVEWQQNGTTLYNCKE